MKIRHLELWDDNKEAKKIKSKEVPEGWKNIKDIIHYQGLPYMPKVLCLELISRYYDNYLIGHFEMEKT